MGIVGPFHHLRDKQKVRYMWVTHAEWARSWNPSPQNRGQDIYIVNQVLSQRHAVGAAWMDKETAAQR